MEAAIFDHICKTLSDWLCTSSLVVNTRLIGDNLQNGVIVEYSMYKLDQDPILNLSPTRYVPLSCAMKLAVHTYIMQQGIVLLLRSSLFHNL